MKKGAKKGVFEGFWPLFLDFALGGLFEALRVLKLPACGFARAARELGFGFLRQSLKFFSL